MPGATRAILTVAAAEDTGDLALVLRAALTLGATAVDLGPAERAGLLSAHGSVLAFRHPLVKAAAYRGAPLAQRQRAHRALADALARFGETSDAADGADGSAADRRAHQLSAAATGPDEAAGVLMEHSAARADARGAPAAASASFERAAASRRTASCGPVG